MPNRRTFLLTGSAALASVGRVKAADKSLHMGSPEAFSFDRLTEEAQRLASRSFVPPRAPPAAILDRIDYEALGKVHFDTSYALFRDGPGQFPVTFFPLGKFSRTPVRMFAIEGGATAREIIYSPNYFDMPAASPVRELPSGAGFAGFRFQERRLGDQTNLDWRKNDWVAFQGASYFRTIGELYQYGLSARGIAVNVAAPGMAEEFPAFTRFYFAPGAADSDKVTVYAFLDGPSVTGAYRFQMERAKAVLMDVDARIFVRKDVHLGMAPLTSMYWFSETEKPTAVDWRPEVHDSDGLAMWTGSGEHIWRPLNDPATVVTSSFMDTNPKGFGLLQRDRVFDHYLDGVHYERRPSLWVEPLADWGDGAVTLVEIPTDDEINDNIVAYWVPKQPAGKGDALKLRYRLHWSKDEPFAPQMAVCVATRLGRGGQPGKPRPKGMSKLVVEFLGGPLATLPAGRIPEAVLSAPSGHFSGILTEAVPDGIAGHWRTEFDFTPDGPNPVDMRLYLRLGQQTLSETWLYQFRPTKTVP